jgi:DNA-binding CsgD family transcriptional regulator
MPAYPTAAPEPLTSAEADVAARIVRGESRRTIAEARGVSIHTVDTQIRALLDKLGVHSASELVAVLAVGTA